MIMVRQLSSKSEYCCIVPGEGENVAGHRVCTFCANERKRSTTQPCYCLGNKLRLLFLNVFSWLQISTIGPYLVPLGRVHELCAGILLSRAKVHFEVDVS